LLYNGHMDTIAVEEHAAWAHDPFGGIIEDDVLYGRGAVDMKAGLAAMIYGVKLLADAGVNLGGQLYVAFVVQQEPSEGTAARILIEEEGIEPDFVVLGEPTNLGVYIGQRGRIELQVTTHGHAAHAAAPEHGVNAIYAAARVVFGVELLATQLLSDPTLGQGTIAVTEITSSGDSCNAIPDRCTMTIDRRLTLGETEVRAISEVQQIIKREDVQAEIAAVTFDNTSYTGYSLQGRKYQPPWLMPEGDPLVRKTLKAVEHALGARPRLGVWQFSTDGAYTMGVAGIPTVGFGPGEERYAHTPEEQVRLADVALAASAYAQLASELLPGR
jgi:putative selenium metabolism hydrolase